MNLLQISRRSPSHHHSRPLTRTIRGEMTESAQLDEELLNTHVDPLVLKRTIRQEQGPRMRRSSPEDERRFVPTRTIQQQDYYDRRVRQKCLS